MQSDLAKKNALLDHATALNKQLESSYLGLALVLVEIEETNAYTEAGYDSFTDYYRKELGREKTTVSRLLTVGKWLKTNGLLKATAPYQKLELAIKAYPDREPAFILAAAENNTMDELKEERLEAKFGPHDHQAGEERFALCTKCNKFMRLP